MREVQKVLGSLKSIKSSGPNNIPARLLKEGAVEIAPSLTRRFNLSLLQASVPAAWKEAHVIPLHKKGDRSNVKNYRPVSLTSVVSKVLEKVLHFHLYKHLSTSDLLSNAQHGFVLVDPANLYFWIMQFLGSFASSVETQR